MARVSVQSDEVERMVEDGLVPLFAATGSVAAMARRLNDALRALGEGRAVHPNRLQALLSDDVSRGVNEVTLDLVGRALEALRSRRTADDEAVAATFSLDLRNRVAALADRGVAGLDAVQEELGIPRAVLRAAIGKPRAEAAPRASSSLPPPSQGPDWSFQDVAVARTLDALRRRPLGSVGLVLPTGAGKTRTALRVVLATLARGPEGARVVWLTHRRTLRRQANATLRALLRDGAADLPAGALGLADRIAFAMISEADELLDGGATPLLVVVDEAHHAAAASYRPVFRSRRGYPVLLLTATPNRADRLPIGMDEVAYTITFRELAERRVVLVPEFEALPLKGFALTRDAIGDLADRLVDESAERFTKTLIIVSTVEQVVALHDALVARLATEGDHPLGYDDIGFLHGGGNSHRLEEGDFLARFADKPRAILVSAQMLLEGFDDPSIDAVVMTYPTTSVSKLMQAVGRCVRHSPGKERCYVLQADDPALAYRFDQRWLYQEIDDHLRPDLVDEEFGGRGELLDRVAGHLEAHRVRPAGRAATLELVAGLSLGREARLLFYGLPYYGPPAEFGARSRWGVFVETPENSAAFRAAFNGYGRLKVRSSDPSEYLATIAPALGLAKDERAGGLWRSLVELLTAAYFAGEELYGLPGTAQASRPHVRNGCTTWLRYVVLHHVPRVPPPLAAFLDDCHNGAELEEEYASRPERARLALKTPLPLGGFEGVLLDDDRAGELDRWLDKVRAGLLAFEPGRQFEGLAAVTSSLTPPRLPSAHLARLEALLPEPVRKARTLPLHPFRPSGERT